MLESFETIYLKNVEPPLEIVQDHAVVGQSPVSMILLFSLLSRMHILQIQSHSL